MYKYFYVSALIFAVLFVSCADEKQTEDTSAKKNEVVFKDKYATTKDGEIIIDGTDSEGITAPIITSQKSLKELPKTALDGSQISTMYDAFGNKTEIRTFTNNLLVQSVIVRTFSDGRCQIFVYGQNGEVRNLPENLYNRVSTASGNFLANAAGIFTGRKNGVAPTPEESLPTLLTVPASPVDKPPQIADAPETIKEKQPIKKNLSADLQKLELKPFFFVKREINRK